MMLIITLLLMGGCGYGILYTYKHLSQSSAVSVGKKRDQVIEGIESISTEITDLLKYKDSYCAKGQFDTVSTKLDGLKGELEKERKELKELESRLDEAQTNVEGKETHQQELKSSREEDEIKLEELLANYGEVSAEAISLEQKLAQSMKNLDSISGEASLTEDQKELVGELSEALSNAGENMRNLLMEYETVNERLTMLQEQHQDLEDEYTKLVEQQLGE